MPAGTPLVFSSVAVAWREVARWAGDDAVGEKAAALAEARTTRRAEVASFIATVSQLKIRKMVGPVSGQIRG